VAHRSGHFLLFIMLFGSTVFFALFSSYPKVKKGKIVVRMNKVRFAQFSAKWGEMGGKNDFYQGFIYSEISGILCCWGR